MAHGVAGVHLGCLGVEPIAGLAGSVVRTHAKLPLVRYVQAFLFLRHLVRLRIIIFLQFRRCLKVPTFDWTFVGSGGNSLPFLRLVLVLRLFIRLFGEIWRLLENIRGVFLPALSTFGAFIFLHF